jgi:hypothetical protein
MKHVLIWLALAVAFAVGGSSLDWIGYRGVVTHGVRVRATVTAVLPKDHASARYQYQADGRTFRGQMCPWPPNPPLEQLRVGQTVVVYYDPEFPGNSVLGDPRLIWRNEVETFAVGALLFPTILVFGWRHQSRRRRASRH